MSLLVLAVLLAPPAEPKLGIGLEGIGGRGLEFVDVMKTSRPWQHANGSPAKMDTAGWPLEDARVVVFDMRPTMAWAPPMDDPDAYQIDVSGTYHLRFTGKATVNAASESVGVTTSNARYDAKTNTSDVNVTVAKGKALVVLDFTNTTGGVKNVRMLRPGYPADTKQTFHKPFLDALKPFPVLRFMDWLDTNGNNLFYGDAKNTIDWSQRRLPTDATQNSTEEKGKKGVAWEYVAELARVTGDDIWINVPAPASDAYIKDLAKFLKKNIPATTKVYVEYSNEVWNWGFIQATYNQMAAEDEAKRGIGKLDSDGNKDKFVWRRRRHARKTMEIGKALTAELGSRVRPVMAWWAIQPAEYEDMLAWLKSNYGDPRKYLHGIALAPYFNTEKAGPNASVDQLIATMRQDSNDSVGMRKAVINVAKKYGLEPMCYEGGPDSGGGNPQNIANRIRAMRDPRMEELVYRDLKNNWFDQGGGLFMYFTLSSAYSRYGMWGLTDDITRTETPKFRGIRRVL